MFGNDQLRGFQLALAGECSLVCFLVGELNICGVAYELCHYRPWSVHIKYRGQPA